MSSSSKRPKAGSLWSRLLRARKALSPQEVLYQNLDLPLSVFIRCVVHGDLSALIIRDVNGNVVGQPSEVDIAQAWSNIYSQYLDANNDSQVSYIIQLQKDISLLTSHVIEVEGAIFYLGILHHDGLVKILKDNGYDYTGDLEIVSNQLSMKRQQLESKVKEYKDYQDAHANDEINESYFLKTLVRLAKYQGVALIRTKDISVIEFVTLLKDYIEYVNANNKQLQDVE